jgi:hypothetical protein
VYPEIVPGRTDGLTYGSCGCSGSRAQRFMLQLGLSALDLSICRARVSHYLNMRMLVYNGSW